MPIRLSRFEMPHKIEKEEGNATGTYARFIAEPFEIGYARTIGNSLRRVLLSSIEGCAISSVKIAGVHHEFATIKGCAEDVTEIILRHNYFNPHYGFEYDRSRLCERFLESDRSGDLECHL